MRKARLNAVYQHLDNRCGVNSPSEEVVEAVYDVRPCLERIDFAFRMPFVSPDSSRADVKGAPECQPGTSGRVVGCPRRG